MPVPNRKPATAEFRPYWTTTDNATVKLWHGDVVGVLKKLPTQSVHCVVTSPPYWGLRNYQTAEWVGGTDPTCNHVAAPRGNVRTVGGFQGAQMAKNDDYAQAYDKYDDHCSTCGANKIDLQLGSEPSPDCGTNGNAQCGRCFVCSMVAVFRGVRRVLRDDGTCWLNLGDSYGDGGQLQGVPWRVALALQADGWVLRQDVIWHKPAPMPESVRNRCTKAHEYVFLLTKGPRYFYDAEAVKEPSRNPGGIPGGHKYSDDEAADDLGGKHTRATLNEKPVPQNSNKRSVWSVSSQGYDGAHFATFPPKLIEPMILAATSAKGACAKCGAPWRRVTEKRSNPAGIMGIGNNRSLGKDLSVRSRDYEREHEGFGARTVGWEPGCTCHGRFEKRTGTRLGYCSYHDHAEDGVAYGLRQNGDGRGSVPGEPTVELKATWQEYVPSIPLADHPVVPCTVCDPFVGSGTSVAVALSLGRRGWGIDLSERYLSENAVVRVRGELLARPSTAHLVPADGGKPVVRTKGTNLLG